MPSPAFDPTVPVNASRLDLEAAGSPSYVVAVVDAEGAAHLAPVIFSQRIPAQDHALTLEKDRQDDEDVVVVGREADGRRAMFSVYDVTMRRLHRQLEVVETTLAEDDPAVGGRL
jgi:hypothetical protein